MKHPVVQYLLAGLFYLYSHICLRLNRLEFPLRKDMLQYATGERGCIFAFWHGRVFFMPHLAPSRERFHAIVSRHGDGSLIGRVLSFFGVRLIRGSSQHRKPGKSSKQRGGAQALKAALETLQRGKHVVITPDGPRGPRMRVNGNIIAIAQKTGAPIIPVAFASSRCKIFHSWDRFMLPLPFGKVVVKLGEAITVPATADIKMQESARQQLEKSLNLLTFGADVEAGLVPVLPEPA